MEKKVPELYQNFCFRTKVNTCFGTLPGKFRTFLARYWHGRTEVKLAIHRKRNLTFSAHPRRKSGKIVTWRGKMLPKSGKNRPIFRFQKSWKIWTFPLLKCYSVRFPLFVYALREMTRIFPCHVFPTRMLNRFLCMASLRGGLSWITVLTFP